MNSIVDELNALEHPINGFFEDVEELKRHQHPEANDFYKQYVVLCLKIQKLFSRVYGLQQRRTVYLDRLTNQLLVRLGLRTESMMKENVARLESIRQSTFSRVEECIEWVRIRMEKLTSMEFLEDLETLEEMFEQHKLDNRDIQDFRQNVDECIARQVSIISYSYKIVTVSYFPLKLGRNPIIPLFLQNIFKFPALPPDF